MPRGSLILYCHARITCAGAGYPDLREAKGSMIVPTPVLGEWWRGRTDWRETILASIIVEPLDTRLAKTAGEAMAHVRGATLVDAVVMASAARAGGVVYTSDFDDLARLQTFFPTVRVLSSS